MAEDVFGQSVDRRITSVAALRETARAASGPARTKTIDHIDAVAARFIAAAPLAFLATRRANGDVDVSPRGDPPGSVRVLDRHTLALPDRRGNNRLEAVEGILETGAAAVLFVVPGSGDTLRAAGQAAVVEDAALSAAMAVAGQPPERIILVRVDRLFCHCPKAFVRGRVWQPDDWPEAGSYPTLAEMLKAHCDMPEPLTEIEGLVDHSLRTTLY